MKQLIFTLRFAFLSVFFTFIFNSYAFAQSTSLSGKIVDQKNGEELIGATVRIANTSMGAAADVNGQYLIKNIPPGTYTIDVSLVGYVSKSLKNITIAAGESKVLSVELQPSTKELQEFVTTAKIDRQTSGGLLIQQKNLSSISDGISSETIKRSPDKTTGDALKRVSGVTVQDNRFVVVRGLADRYNIALINGVDLPTTEPDKKAFSFDIIPSALIDNMVIYKTASPELRADFGGGAVYVTTKDIPERKIFNINVSTQYNTYTTFKPYVDYKGGKLDFLGVDDGTRALPKSLASSKDFGSATIDEEVRNSKMIGNDWGINNQNSQSPGFGIQAIFGNNFKFLNKEWGVIASFSTSSTPKTYNNNIFTYGGGGATNDTIKWFSLEDNSYEKNHLTGILFNTSVKLNNNHKISLKNLANINGEDVVINRFGYQNENGIFNFEKGFARQFTSNIFYSGQAKYEGYIPSIKLKINGTIGINNTSRDMPGQKRLLYNSSLNEFDSIFKVAFPAGSPNPMLSGMTYTYLKENGNIQALDLTRTFKWKINNPFTIKIYRWAINIPGNTFKPTFKTGFYQSNKERTFNARVFGWRLSTNIFQNPSLLELKPGEIFADSNITKDRFRMNEITSNTDKYTASSSLKAAYFSVDHYLFTRLRLNYGIRYESFNQKLNAFDPYSAKDTTYDNTYNNFFPIVNLTYNITEKINFRSSYSKTVVRPEFREIAPFTYYDYVNNTITYGKSNLKPIQINNLDLRFEIYPTGGQVFTFTYFYKTFENAIENTFDYGAGNRTRTFNNIKSVECSGYELEFRLNPGIVFNTSQNSISRYFTFSLNSSIINSKVDLSNLGGLAGSDNYRPLQGQSGYSVNTGILVMPPSGKWNLNVLYNRIGRRMALEGGRATLHIWEVPRDLIDVQFSYQLNKYVTAKAIIGDILNQYYRFYRDTDLDGKYTPNSTDVITNQCRYGSNFSLSLAINLY